MNPRMGFVKKMAQSLDKVSRTTYRVSYQTDHIVEKMTRCLDTDLLESVPEYLIRVEREIF